LVDSWSSRPRGRKLQRVSSLPSHSHSREEVRLRQRCEAPWRQAARLPLARFVTLQPPRVDFHPSFQTLTSIFPHTEARKQAEFERWYFAEEEKKRYQQEQKALREARHGPKVVPALHYTPYTDNVTTLADDAEKKRWPKGSSSAVAPKFTPAPPEDVGYNPQHPTQRKRIFERDDPNDLTSGPLWKWVLDHKSSNESLKSAYGPDETIPESAFRDGSGRDPAVLASAQNAAEQREASAQVDRSVNFTRYYHHPGLTQSLTKHEAPPTEPHSAAGDGHHND